MFDHGSVSRSPLTSIGLFCLIVVTLAGCNQLKGSEEVSSNASSTSQPIEEPKQHPATSKMLGKWVVIADTAGQGHTGNLILKPDLTFTSEYVTKKSKETISGTFTVSDEKVANENLIAVELTLLQYNGKPAPAPGPLRLFYDSESNILHDFLSVAYSRPGEEIKGKKYFERK